MQAAPKDPSLRRTRPNFNSFHVGPPKAVVMTRARQILNQCRNLKSVASSKRSTAISRHVDQQINLHERIREQNSPQTRQKVIHYFSVFGLRDPKTVSEDGLFREFFPGRTPLNTSERDIRKQIETSTIEVVKMGKSIHLSRVMSLKHSQLISSALAKGYPQEFELSHLKANQNSNPRPNASVGQLPREIGETIDKLNRNRASLSQKLQELGSLVELSQMAPSNKRLSKGKLGYIERTLGEHFEDLSRLEEKMRPMMEYDVANPGDRRNF